MARIAKTAFEVSVSNINRNETQNIPGYFGSGTNENYVPEICPAGFLTIKLALAQSEGYESYGILNGNTWRMIAAVNSAASGFVGDHTGIYAFNSYNVNQVSDINGNVYNIGANTLGLELPAGERGDFTEIIIGEQYTFGEGNFSTLPTDATYKYITIANGLLVASTVEPSAGDGVYFELLRTKGFTVGVRAAGFDGYVCVAKRA